MRVGVVASFDAFIGLGVILCSSDAAASTEIPFHCIAIADGTRTIDIGARVTFDTLCKLGRYEATNIIAT